VGYQIRFENRTSAETRLRIVTEGILERRLLSDPYLDRVGCVIFDEFHERSLHGDLSLALLREVQQSARPDLRILVMSATLDSGQVSRYLGHAPVLNAKGRTFPVDIRYSDKSQPLNTGRQSPLVPSVVASVRKLVQDPPHDGGHILVFLPGTAEIRACHEGLKPLASEADLELLSLHGSLSSEEQDRALRPSSRRKVILATNIAETSLTIDGVTSVVDSGLVRVFRNDPRFGAERLELQRISKDSAEQRAGRAGRQAPGRCLRLWSQHDQTQLAPHIEPEIFRVDLAPTLLILADWGVSDPRRFDWFEAPPESQLNSALQLLKELGALDNDAKITSRGRELLEWPLSPRLATLMLAARDQGLEYEGALLAALMSEKDILRRDFDVFRLVELSHTSESDLLLRWHLVEALEQGTLRGSATQALDMGAVKQVQRVRDALVRTHMRSHQSETRLMKLLLRAFPDRVCRRREAGSREARMVGGRGVLLEENSVVRDAEFFLALNPFEARTGGHLVARLSWASRIEEAWLRESFENEVTLFRQVEWDEGLGKSSAFEEWRYRDLPLSERRPVAPSPHELRQILSERLRQDPVGLLNQNASAQRLLLRLEFLAKFMPELEWPAFDSSFFGELLTEAVESGMDPLGDDSLFMSLVENRLSVSQRNALQREAPDKIQVPSGSLHRIEYFGGEKNPMLSLRLQEIFGWARTPRLARGRVPLTLELLSPGFKPVQTTQDLESFWARGYAEVKKELRARYPRHSWPEDPLSAKAEAKGGRRRS
jgi:ATP-dependent helicase HrpB